MTVQTADTVIYNNKKYDFIKLSEYKTFNSLSLSDYGIKPKYIATNCWIGYMENYQIIDQKLYLKDIYVNSKDSFYPIINGIELTKPTKNYNDIKSFYHLYENLNIENTYTGKMLIGCDSLDYTNGWDYEQIWSYQTLIEVYFEDGKLIHTCDYSHVAGYLRDFIYPNAELRFEIVKTLPQLLLSNSNIDLDDVAWWFE